MSRSAPWWRVLGIAGALLGTVSMIYLSFTWVDDSTLAWLHAPTARRAELTYGGLALVAAVGALILTVSPLRWAAVVGLVVAGLLYGIAGANAIASSERHDRLASTLAFVVLAAALMIAAALWGVSTLTRPRWRGPVAMAASVAVALPVLAFTWAEGPLEESRIFAGLHAAWNVEHRADQVTVDEAGNAWGMQPWEETEPVTISLLRPGADDFDTVDERATGWAPAILGTDAAGATWLVSSELRDPFEPVVERFDNGRLVRVPSPPTPLPPLDAVALDRVHGQLYALHSNFTIPARAVLERFDGTHWSSSDTPIAYPGRASLLDMAVDPRGALWVWHDDEPATLRRFDGAAWTSVSLPFDIESPTDLSLLSPALDPFSAFLVAPDGALWLFDRDKARLIQLDDTGVIDQERPLDEECAPLAIDRDANVWCRGPAGLLVVGPDGRVAYDAEADGVPESTVHSVAITPDTAWVRLERGRAIELLRFDHRDALDE